MASSRPPSSLWRLRSNLPARRIGKDPPVQRVPAWERPLKELKEPLDPVGSAASTTDGVVGRPKAGLVDHPFMVGAFHVTHNCSEAATTQCKARSPKGRGFILALLGSYLAWG
jgi:hypothetical protein